MEQKSKISKSVYKKNTKNLVMPNNHSNSYVKGMYWKGKKKDQHTVDSLAESKYIPILEYSKDGDFVRVWESVKEAAISVFKDYVVTNGSAYSKLYYVLKSRTMKGRFRHGSYWFKQDDMMKYFNCVPKRINIDAFKEKEKEDKVISRNNKPRRVQLEKRQYTVIQYNPDMTVKEKYDNINEAAFVLKIHPKTAQRICLGICKKASIILRYGEKLMQPTNVSYTYEIEPTPKIMKERKYIRTCTRKNVLYFQYGVEVLRFNDVAQAGEYFNLLPSVIRTIIIGRAKKYNLDLRYGDKCQAVKYA